MRNAKPIIKRLLLPGLAVLGLSATAAAVQATPRLAGLLDAAPQISDVQSGLRQPANAAPTVSPAQAAQAARDEHGGKVLSVDLRRNGGQPFYRVKIIDNGNVRTVQIPAN